MMIDKLRRIQKSRIVRQATALIETHPNIRPIALLLGVILAIYGVAKGRDRPQRDLANDRAAEEFHSERIFGSSVTSLYLEKDGALSKATREYADVVKAIKESVDAINKRLTRLEASTGAPTATAAVGIPQTAPAPPVEAGAGQGSQSNGSVGIREAGGASVQQSGQSTQYQPSGSAPPTTPAYSPGSGPPGFQPYGMTSRGPGTLSFPVKNEEPAAVGITLPAGSYVRGKMLTGVAAPEGRPYPVLLQLDYAHVLPNRRRLDLAGCFMIAKAQGDLSTERLQMQATKMSCVGRDGRMFERDITGFVADDKDNNFAVAGEVVSKQDRVAAMAFLSSVVEGIGRSVQQSQTTQQTTPLGGSQSVLTGDEQKYIAAGGASNAAGMVAQWYLKQAQGLLPTINVNSGQDIWVILQESVSLPKTYFKRSDGGKNLETSYSYVTRLLE